MIVWRDSLAPASAPRAVGLPKVGAASSASSAVATRTVIAVVGAPLSRRTRRTMPFGSVYAWSASTGTGASRRKPSCLSIAGSRPFAARAAAAAGRSREEAEGIVLRAVPPAYQGQDERGGELGVEGAEAEGLRRGDEDPLLARDGEGGQAVVPERDGAARERIVGVRIRGQALQHGRRGRAVEVVLGLVLREDLLVEVRGEGGERALHAALGDGDEVVAAGGRDAIAEELGVVVAEHVERDAGGARDGAQARALGHGDLAEVEGRAELGRVEAEARAVGGHEREGQDLRDVVDGLLRQGAGGGEVGEVDGPVVEALGAARARRPSRSPAITRS